MTKVISIGTDRNLFKEGSAVRDRQIEYGQLFDELHIIVFTKWIYRLPKKLQICPNVWVYGTNSVSKFTYTRGALDIAGRLMKERGLLPENTVVTVQDPFESGLVGVKLKKKFGFPLQVQAHTDFQSHYFKNESLMNRIRAILSKKVFSMADSVRVVSKRIAESLGKIRLQEGVKPVVLPIYTDIKKIEDTEITIDLKKKYPQFNFIILMASRLTREKNISFAVKVFAKLLNIYSRTGLVIVGSGPEEGKLKRLVRRLGIGKNVIFEPWQDNMATYYKTANIFLSTSNYEGYGLTLVEATAAHCPTISTDVGIAPEILKDGVSYVCPIGDHNCFLEKISSLIEDVALRESYSHESRDRLDLVTIESKKAYLEQYKSSIEAALKKSGERI